MVAALILLLDWNFHFSYFSLAGFKSVGLNFLPSEFINIGSSEIQCKMKSGITWPFSAKIPITVPSLLQAILPLSKASVQKADMGKRRNLIKLRYVHEVT